jgi:STE24 endopeptidase
VSTAPDQARQYARIRYRLLCLDLILGMGVLAAFQWSGGSTAVARWWTERLAIPPLALLGYLAVFGLLYYTAMLPLHFYGSFVLEHRFGLSRLSVGGWLLKEVKQAAVSAVLGVLLAQGLYALLRAAPTGWPFWATVGWVAFSVGLARLFPTVLLPIFYKTTPLADAALAARLLALCRRVGVEALGVFRFDLGVE